MIILNFHNTTDVLNIKDPLTFEQFMKGSGKKL